VLGISENILFSAENFQAECFEDGEGFRQDHDGAGAFTFWVTLPAMKTPTVPSTTSE
jgi:hypothetical protein